MNSGLIGFDDKPFVQRSLIKNSVKFSLHHLIALKLYDKLQAYALRQVPDGDIRRWYAVSQRESAVGVGVSIGT